MQCFREDGKPLDDFVLAELRNDGLYNITCPKGHITLTALQEQKFEILFDCGALALLDGYPREAIATTAVALERFLEFYIETICLKYNISLEDFDQAWKEVASQSERQYGAFHFLYLLENKTSLTPSPSNMKPTIEGSSKNKTKTWVEFRNNVIHQGYIPSTEEAYAYIDLIYNFIISTIEELKRNYSEHVTKVIVHHLVKASKSQPTQSSVGTMSIPTLINLASGEKPIKDFKEALNRLKVNKSWLYHK
jgi:hypothetical protein